MPPINHTWGITVSRFSLVYKIALYLVLITVLFSALAFATIFPTTRAMLGELSDLHLIRETGDYVLSIFRGVANAPADGEQPGSQAYQDLVALYQRAGTIVAQHTLAVTMGVVLLVLWLLCFVIAITMCNYPVSGVLHAFMSSNSEYGFSANYIATMAKSIRYAIANVFFCLVYLGLGLSIAVCLGMWISMWNNLFGLMVTYSLILFVCASNRALCAGWLPAMVVDQRPVKLAFADACKMARKTFVEMLGAYIVIFIAFSMLLIGVGLFTFGIGMILVIACMIVFTQAYDMAMFYRYHEYRYYIDDQTVIDPKRHYKDAILEDPLQLQPAERPQPLVPEIENDGSPSEGEEQ